MTTEQLTKSTQQPPMRHNQHILNMLCDGKTQREVAVVCGLSSRTIENRIVVLRAKNHCATTNQLIHKYTLFAHNVIQYFYL